MTMPRVTETVPDSIRDESPRVAIRPTDCRTGYLVLVGGKIVESCPSRAYAESMAEYWRERTGSRTHLSTGEVI